MSAAEAPPTPPGRPAAVDKAKDKALSGSGEQEAPAFPEPEEGAEPPPPPPEEDAKAAREREQAETKAEKQRLKDEAAEEKARKKAEAAEEKARKKREAAEAKERKKSEAAEVKRLKKEAAGKPPSPADEAVPPQQPEEDAEPPPPPPPPKPAPQAEEQGDAGKAEAAAEKVRLKEEAAAEKQRLKDEAAEEKARKKREAAEAKERKRSEAAEAKRLKKEAKAAGKPPPPADEAVPPRDLQPEPEPPAEAVLPVVRPPDSDPLPGAGADGCVGKWMEKKSPAKMKGWQKRWFVFDPYLGELRYSAAQNDPQPTRLPLAECIRFESDNLEGGCFELHFSSRPKPTQLRLMEKQRSALYHIEK